MAMLSLARRIPKSVFDGCPKFIPPRVLQLRFARTDAGNQPPHNRRRSKFSPSNMLKKADGEKSEWWVVDGEMHEVGENVPPRERFVIPRENLPNKRRKQLREQFMRRTRLVLKESEHEPWCKRYMELYNELRENWERLYWDEGYSKKLAQDHANYDSAEDDDEDFNPYRRRQNRAEPFKEQGMGRNREGEIWQNTNQMRGMGGNREGETWQNTNQMRGMGRNTEGETWQNTNQMRGDTWQKASQIRDKFEYDREQRMRAKAFAPITGGNDSGRDDFTSRSQPFSAQRYISESEGESDPMTRGNDSSKNDFTSGSQPFSAHRYMSDSDSESDPMTGGNDSGRDDFTSRSQPFRAQRHMSESESDPMTGGNDSGRNDFTSRSRPVSAQRYMSESESD